MPDLENAPIAKLEGKWMAFITAIALFFGGWWLQNQYTATLSVQARLAEFMEHVDDKYVEKEYLRTVDQRLTRIENKLESISDAQRHDTQGGR